MRGGGHKGRDERSHGAARCRDERELRDPAGARAAGQAGWAGSPRPLGAARAHPFETLATRVPSVTCAQRHGITAGSGTPSRSDRGPQTR